jgi:serine/threonine protein kinase
MTDESIFAVALDKAPGAERLAFLDTACGGDAGLRRRVERLLDADRRNAGFLEREPDAASPGATPAPLAADRPFADRFRLRQKLGEGGMGEVWVADQAEPVHRCVALKVVRPGFDSARLLARFDQERQALALMDHPNIAKVLDAGDAGGRPYFVMELIKGLPITQYCDEARLTPRQRLELFIPVCQAVQHAHQKGIIHRDLKPSNILVALYDGQPVPKVIDFGVAKATGPQLTEQCVSTEVGVVIGTLEYMSPEQAELNSLDIDTRSDVYTLGVVLYELLTGCVPFSRKELQSASFFELLRIIKESEPPKPSTKLSGSGTLPSVAAVRQTVPQRLVALVRGELDWIVMKCLEKDRGRRYQTANALARDLERYLNDEPVEACPPSAAYRMRKLAYRNRKWLTGMVAFGVLLAAGAAVSTWQAVRATAALAGEAEQRQQAQQSEAEARAVLEFVQNKVFAAARPKGIDGGLGSGVTLRQALEAALPVVDQSFARQPLTEASVRVSLGSSFYDLGDGAIAADQYGRALALFREHRGADDADTLATMNKLANAYDMLGNPREAVKLREEVLPLQEARLGRTDPETIATINSLGQTYRLLSRYDDAVRACEQTLERRRDRFGPTHPAVLAGMMNLSIAYAHVDRKQDAARLCEEAFALQKAQLGPTHPDTLLTMLNLANCYDDANRYADALILREETLPLLKATYPLDHPITMWGMHNLANSYAKFDRHDEALKLREETLALREAKLGPTHRDTLQSMKTLAESLIKLGNGARAVSVIDECVRRSAGQAVHAKLIPNAMDLRMRYFEELKDAAGCRATAEMWEQLGRTDAASLYQAAGCRAVTAVLLRATDTAAAAAEADGAMAWLRQAVAAGYKDVTNLRQNKDLQVLHGRADFQELLAGLTSPPGVTARHNP